MAYGFKFDWLEKFIICVWPGMLPKVLPGVAHGLLLWVYVGNTLWRNTF